MDLFFFLLLLPLFRPPEINRKWGDHLKSMGNLRDILMYMDRTWVSNNQKKPTHELGLLLWRDEVVRNPKIQEVATETRFGAPS